MLKVAEIPIPFSILRCSFFFFNDTATTEIYTLSLHDALPICAFAPDRTTPVGVSYHRAKFSTHPRSSHGAGGEFSANTPHNPGSNIVGVSVVRFTGAKYARICRVTGTIAARNGVVLIKALPPRRRKPSAPPAAPRAHPDKRAHTSPAAPRVPDKPRCCLPLRS